VAEDDGPGVLVVGELGEKDVQRGTEGVQRIVADVLGEDEDGERQREGEVRKCRLYQVSAQQRFTLRVSLTSSAMPGTKSSTARAWKNFRRALRLRCAAFLSATVPVSVDEAALPTDVPRPPSVRTTPAAVARILPDAGAAGTASPTSSVAGLGFERATRMRLAFTTTACQLMTLAAISSSQ
jgi:hypothetical protein